MMRLQRLCLIALLSAGLVPARDPKPPADAAVPDDQPQVEPASAGSVTVGYRWLGDVNGNLDTYRSVVNLGEGPRVLGFDYRFRNPDMRWLDRLDVNASGWGGDPASFIRINAEKARLYRLDLDYRDIAYFNALPSFANPFTGAGVLSSQQTYDITRRMLDARVELRLGTRLVPYFAYTRESGSGRGISNFVAELNEYAAASVMDNRNHQVRGGVRMEASRAQLTLETGWNHFRDEQGVFAAERSMGNRSTPLAGRTLFIDDAQQVYDVTGKGVFTRVNATAQPLRGVGLAADFLFSQPKIDSTFASNASGTLVDLTPLTFLNMESDLVAASAKQPHTAGSFTADLSPFARLRIIEMLTTDRLHNATRTAGGAFDRLEWSYNEQQIEAVVDVPGGVTLRGGHKYTWGESQFRAPQLTFVPGFESGSIERHSGLAGAAWRWRGKLSANVNGEIADSTRAYFRTGLDDFWRVRARARYQVLPSLSAGVDLNRLANHTESPLGGFDWRQHYNGLSIFWDPDGGKRVQLLGDYGRTTIRSSTLFIVPQDLTRGRSEYREKGHSASAMVDVGGWTFGGRTPRFGFGGSLYISEGTRPVEYFIPVVRLAVPVLAGIEPHAEWRWYGFSQDVYRYETFRGHQFVAGVKYGWK